MPNRRCKETSGDPLLVQVQLLGPVQNVPDQFPVDEILAMKDRNAGEIRERRVHQIVVAPNSADARIGIEARKNGIRKPSLLLRGTPEEKNEERNTSQHTPIHSGIVLIWYKKPS